MALSPNPDFPRDPGLVESKDIGMIMNRLADWKRIGPVTFAKYGKQRAWEKVTENALPIPNEDDPDALPF